METVSIRDRCPALPSPGIVPEPAGGPAGGLDRIPDKGEDVLSPGPSLRASAAGTGVSGKPEAALPMQAWRRMAEPAARDDLRWYLLNKYRELLVTRIGAEELAELRFCQRRWSETGDRWCQRRFIRTLQEYIPGEILQREITGIESLIALIRPDDLEPGRPGPRDRVRP